MTNREFILKHFAGLDDQRLLDFWSDYLEIHPNLKFELQILSPCEWCEKEHVECPDDVCLCRLDAAQFMQQEVAQRDVPKAVEATCRTCEFNSDGKCFCGDDGDHRYGETIKDDMDTCCAWSCGKMYFSQTIMHYSWLCFACPNYKKGYCLGVTNPKMSLPRKRP